MELKQLPQSLSDITLQKWVEWEETYGKELVKDSKKAKTADETLLFNDRFYRSHYSHYSDTPIEELDDALIVEIITASSVSMAQLFRQKCDLENVDVVNAVFEFDGRLWKIVPPVIIANEKDITVPEFEIMQDVALILSDLQDGTTTAFYELCDKYLKPVIPDEEESHLELFKSLPLSIAFCVKKYIQDTILLYNTLKNDGKRIVS